MFRHFLFLTVILSCTACHTHTRSRSLQDVFYIISSAGSNRHGRDLTWEFVKDQWELLCDRYLEGAFLLGRIVSMAIDNFSSQVCLCV